MTSMKPALANTFKFPLENPDDTGAALLRSSQRRSTGGVSPIWPWSWVVWLGVPLIGLGAAFGIGAGASLFDENITMHPLNVFIVWIILLGIDVVIGVVLFIPEGVIRRMFFNHYGTFELVPAGGLPGGGAAGGLLGILGAGALRRGPPVPRNPNATWLVPLMVIMRATATCFLVVIPAIEWPQKKYSYWIAGFRGVLGGLGAGAMGGFQVAALVPRFPSEVAFITMFLTSITTMSSSMATVGIAEAMNVTRPEPVFTITASL